MDFSAVRWEMFCKGEKVTCKANGEVRTYWYDRENEKIMWDGHLGEGEEVKGYALENFIDNVLGGSWEPGERRDDYYFGFENAITYLKRGVKVKRKGWNGKNQYIQLAKGISYETPEGEIVNCEHKDIGNKAIAFVRTSGVQMGWLASQSDMLAEDWTFAEEV